MNTEGWPGPMVPSPTPSRNVWQAGTANAFLPKRLRAEALALVDRKLSGDQRLRAREWLKNLRSEGTARSFMARIAALPDIEPSAIANPPQVPPT